MDFWNEISMGEPMPRFRTLRDLKALNPVSASIEFDDWAGLGHFLLENSTKLAELQCEGLGAFEDEGFMKAAVTKLEFWSLHNAQLGKKEVESLCAAYGAAPNCPALALWDCVCDEELMPQFTEFLAGHLERLKIMALGGHYCDWMQLGDALEQPSSKLRDLSLLVMDGPVDPGDLDWLVEALLSQHCKLRRLCLPVIIKGIAQVLQSPSCILEGVEIAGAIRGPRSYMFLAHPDCRLQSFVAKKSRGHQERVLDAVEGNYYSQLQQLELGPWESDSLKVRCSNLLYRNRVSKGTYGTRGSFFRELSQPRRVLKLFMCGHTGVGKTTVATNLLSSSVISAWQERSSTQGISLMNLEIGDGKALVIFDLAGQEVYHAFHHYFIRRSENDLFLIVCKVNKNNEEHPGENLRRLLTYWLRFIVSHQSANAQTKPKVFVVLNYFCRQNEVEYNASEAANEVLEHFHTKVRLMQPVTEVVALRPSKELLALKEALKRAARVAAQHLPSIPKLCNDLIEEKARKKWYRRTPGGKTAPKTVFHLDELKHRLTDSGDEMAKSNALKFALMCLHHMGEAIYFGSPGDAEEEATLADHAILDVKWFVQDVIGEFIPRLPRNDVRPGERAIIDSNCLRVKLKKLVDHNKDTENQVIVITKYLEEMGVIIRHRGASDMFIIQTLLKDKFAGWQEHRNTAYRYWGRRMQPREEDREFVLLPSGVFSIIQADIAKLCKSAEWQNQQTLSFGDGWISFSKNLVKVLVVVGGENELWTDRQWVDTMLMVPDDKIRCDQAEEILSSMRDCILNLRHACPFLKIEEHVLNPEQVKAFLTLQQPTDCAFRTHIGPSNTGMQTKLLDGLKDLAKVDGLDCHYHWGATDNHSCVGELLMPSELKQLFKSRQSVVDDFNRIAPVYKLKESPVIASFPAIPEFADPETRKLAEYQTQLFDYMTGKITEDFHASMELMLGTLGRIEKSLKFSEKQVLNGLAEMLQHIRAPKFPYLTKARNFIFKYKNPAGEGFSIHYMCESSTGKHPMHNNYEGVPITIAHDWIRKYTSVLVPAITVSFFIAKLGTSVAGIPVNDVLNFAEGRFKASLTSTFPGNLKANIDSCFGQSVNMQQPAQHEVEEVLEHVKKAAEVENLTVLMAKYFGLFFHDHDNAWVCDKHRL